jgi:hypothetical protein
MRILVGCEFSQIVCKAFRDKGHEAYSCDILPTEGNPEWHIQDDVLKHLDDGWDLMIAHPPCTYLSKASACRLYKMANIIDKQRYLMGLDAKAFFLKLLNADIPHIAIENPTPLKVFKLPTHSQVIQPYEFGHPYSKRTLLWLINLPLLKPTKIVDFYKPFLPSNTGGRKRGQHSYTDKHLTRDAKVASKTFQGIAEAMANQWG